MRIIPLQPVPFQFFNVVLNNQPCQLNVYEKETGVYIDVYVSNALIIGGVICQDLNRIVRDVYLGFIGDLAFYDTSSVGDDPFSTGFGSRFVLIYFDATEIATQAAIDQQTSSGVAGIPTVPTTPKQSIHVLVPGTVSRNTAFNVSVSFGLPPPSLSQLQYLNPVTGVPGSLPVLFPATATVAGNVISFSITNGVFGSHTLQVIDNSTIPPTLSDVATYSVV